MVAFGHLLVVPGLCLGCSLLLAATVLIGTSRADHLTGAASAWDGAWTVTLSFRGGLCDGRWPPLEIEIASGQANGRYTEPRFGGWTYTSHVDANANFDLALSGIASITLEGRLNETEGSGDLRANHPEGKCGGNWSAKRNGGRTTSAVAATRATPQSSKPVGTSETARQAAPAPEPRQTSAQRPRTQRLTRSADALQAALPEPPPISPDTLDPPPQHRLRDPELPPFTVNTPGPGQRNAFALLTTPELAAAYEAFLIGDGEASLAALDRMGEGGTLLMRWHVLMQRVDAMVLLGRSADAERLLQNAADLEARTFGKTVMARAARGRIRLALGEFDSAIADFNVVARELRRWNLPTHYGQIPEPSEVAVLVYNTSAQLRAYAGIAEALIQQGRTAEALPWAKAAEAGYADVHFVGVHPTFGEHLPIYIDSYVGRAANLVALGVAQIVARNDVSSGRVAFEAALAFYDTIGFEAGATTAEVFRAEALLTIGEANLAAQVAERAATGAARLGLNDLLWRTELIHADALARLGRHDDEEAALRRAQDAVEEVSGSLAGDRAKRRFGAGKDDLTYRLARINAQRGDLGTLFRDLERGRARAFVDMVADRALSQSGDAELIVEIRAIDRAIIETRLRRATALRTGPNTGQETALRLQRRLLLDRLAAENPELAATLSIATLPLDDVRRALGRNDALAYALPARNKDGQRYLLVTSGKVSLLEATARPEDILRGLQDFADGIALEDTGYQKDAARRLGDLLNLGGLAEDGTLFVVPSGYLHFVPWGALELASPVVVLPTGGWLLRQQAPNRVGAVALGDPALEGVLPALPGAGIEAKAVAQLHGTQALTGEAATFENVTNAVGSGVHILHLATHGVFDAADPLRSALYFAGPNGVNAVTAADLFRRPLAADLVVLSACETGLGETAAGEDYLGLARSFYLAGAKSVINSLWRVDDAGTTLFMTAFHGALARHGNIAKAWQTARDFSRDSGLPPSVYGAFVLGGAATLRQE